MPVHCRFCQSDQTIKYGTIRNKPRYKCKGCKKHFVHELSEKRIDLKTKLQAIEMLKEGVGFRATGRLLGISFSSVKRFFKDRAQIIKESHHSIEVSALKEVESVELDEMFHFVKKK